MLVYQCHCFILLQMILVLLVFLVEQQRSSIDPFDLYQYWTAARHLPGDYDTKCRFILKWKRNQLISNRHILQIASCTFVPNFIYSCF
jgi:hypothetical protein